jgi:hypothetical protein
MSVLRGSQPKGEAMTEMVECPCCSRGGCVVCHGSGLVKKANLDRAREDSDDGWSDAALRRLLSLALVTPDDNIDYDHYAGF